MNSWPEICPESWPGSPEEWALGMAAWQEAEWRRCSQDPWYCIRNYMKTVDQLDEEAPRKPFPDLDYLRLAVDYLLTEKVVIMFKSRRVLATWLVGAFDVWDMIFQEARMIGLYNEKLQKSCEMVWMRGVLYRSLPTWMKARRPAKIKDDEINFGDTHLSRCIALPDTVEAATMYTFSRLVSDEFSGQRAQPDKYRAMLPTIKGRRAGVMAGQLVFTFTSKGENFSELLVHDQVEVPAEVPPPPIHDVQLVDGGPMWRSGQKHHGMRATRQAVAGYLVLWIHYTSDPEKRSPEWYHETRRGVPEEDWFLEFEMDFKAKSGKPALPQFRKYQDKIVVPTFPIPLWWPRWLTIDYGAVHPYSMHAHTLSPDKVVITYWEHYMPGPLAIHLEAALKHEDFQRWRVMILDRSCWTENQQGEKTVGGQAQHMLRSIAQMHQEAGVYVIPAAVVQDRVKIAAYNKVWPTPVDGEPFQPAYQIMDSCPNLVRELPWIRWVKPTTSAKLLGLSAEKLVDEDNHAFDDCAYGLLHIQTPGNEPDAPLPEGADMAHVMRAEKMVAAVARIDQLNQDQFNEYAIVVAGDDEDYD